LVAPVIRFSPLVLILAADRSVGRTCLLRALPIGARKRPVAGAD